MELEYSPAYLANLPLYQLHADWLDGSQERLADYLIKTPFERTAKGEAYYAHRVSRIDVDNDIEAGLQIHLAKLAKSEPAWGGLDEDAAQVLLANINNRGTSAWQFTKELFELDLSFGFAAVEVEATPRVADNAQTARASSERSWARHYEPTDVVRWQYFEDDADGEYKGKLKEVWLKNRIVSDGKKRYQTFKCFSIPAPGQPYSVTIFKCSKELGQEGAAPEVEPISVVIGTLLELPIVFVGDPEKGVRRCVLRRPCILSKILLNKQSAYDEAGYYQGFQRTIMSGSDNPKEDVINVAEHQIGAVSGENVAFHTIAPVDPIALWRDKERLRASIRRYILLQHNQQVSAESRETPSADSKRADSEIRNDFYNQVTDHVETALNELFALCAQFDGFNAENISIVFPREFELVDSDIAQQETTLRWTRASSAGRAGKMIQKQILINDVVSMDIEPVGERSVEEVRQELLDALVAEPVEQATGPITGNRLSMMRGITTTSAPAAPNAETPPA